MVMSNSDNPISTFEGRMEMLKIIVERYTFDFPREKKIVSMEALLRELLGGAEHKQYECSERHWGRVAIDTVCENEPTSRVVYYMYNEPSSDDFYFVEDVMRALVAPGMSTEPWHATTLNERRAFFLSALDLKSRVSVKDLIAAYDLMAETAQTLPVLVEELGLV
jgi:hypothetical protein